MKFKKPIKRRFVIKLPKYLSVIYSKRKKLITFITIENQKKSFELSTEVFLQQSEKIIEVSSLSFNKVSTKERKNLKSKQGTTVALIKHLISELLFSFFCRKMKFVGVGYRAFPLLQNKKNILLRLKLGYSHQIYFRCLDNLSLFCLKFTKLFILGNSYQKVTQFSAQIRLCKPPEPYKGKGVLYLNEKISLKIGKRV